MADAEKHHEGKGKYAEVIRKGVGKYLSDVDALLRQYNHIDGKDYYSTEPYTHSFEDGDVTMVVGGKYKKDGHIKSGTIVLMASGRRHPTIYHLREGSILTQNKLEKSLRAIKVVSHAYAASGFPKAPAVK